ncbi:MAG: NfeD family protein [Candidatus Hydrogenedentes bacterium]|nr:NfeD family protein [Candidatus Hydrogenedentota bacterium]MBI3118567.1 NfeD family protein [Candidatus Hydrogenedentota bacterium]
MALEVWHLWTVAGVLLLIIEIFTSGFIIGVFGAACFAGAVAAWLGLSLNVQLLSFGAATIVFAFTLRPFMLRYGRSGAGQATTNVDALIGREGRVLEAIDPETHAGRVKIGGEDWKAGAVNKLVIPAGARVVVRAVEGCTVMVEHQKG